MQRRVGWLLFALQECSVSAVCPGDGLQSGLSLIGEVIA